MSPQHVGDLLDHWVRRQGMVKAMHRARAVLLWSRVVGADLARFTRARSLKGGVLYVEVPDSETAMHLSLQRLRFVEAYRERFGVREVKEIRFRVGHAPPAEAPREADPPRSPPPEPEAEAWSNLSGALGRMDLPEAVASSALRAGRAFLSAQRRKREAGWRPCPHCGALTPDDGPCTPCARYRASDAVHRAAAQLAVDAAAATPHLSEEERTVARSVARERLDAELEELLPHVIADPSLRDQLEQAARCRLALDHDGRPPHLDDDDWARLDPRVARALGRGR